MKTILIFDHPYTLSASENQPHFRSYSAAVAQRTISYLQANGDTVDVIDLHKDKFDPVMHAADLSNWRTRHSLNDQVDDYFNRLAAAERIIFVFPIWWEVMPAMTKGFIDKVFSKNRIPKDSPKKLFANQPRIDIFTIAGTPTFLYRLKYGNPVIKSLKRGTFQKVGVNNVHWHNFNAEDESAAKRIADLDHIQKFLR